MEETMECGHSRVTSFSLCSQRKRRQIDLLVLEIKEGKIKEGPVWGTLPGGGGRLNGENEGW
jgi:hypothetical protein